MYLKRFFCIIIVFFFILYPITSFADDYIEAEEYMSNLTINVSNDTSKIPNINARHATVLDRNSRTVLYGKCENEQCKMASTTKIMTAIVVLENCNNLNEIVTISKKSAGTGGSRLGLSTDDKITVENLLYGLLLVSGNDAAVALAEFIGGDIDFFSNLMNKKANDLGLKNTNFVTPHGLDSDEHYTTAYELAIIADYALKNPTFSKIVKTSNYTVNINGKSKSLHNTNELLGYLDGIYGVKTGFTNGANRCLVTSCKRGNLDIICVVLGCDTKKDRTQDSIKLINYIFQNYTIVNISEIINDSFNTWKKENLSAFSINKGMHSNLELYLKEDSLPFTQIAVNNQYLDKITTPIKFQSNYNAPFLEDTKVAEMDVLIDNTSYFKIDILNKDFIAQKNILFYMKNFFADFSQFLLTF